MKRAILFLLLWLAIGFSVGTGTLLGPVRWVTILCRERGLGEGVEKAAVTAIIVLLVAVTACVALALTRVVLGSARLEVRLGIPALALAAAVSALALWMEPRMLAARSGEETTSGPRFTFGPYPDEDRLLSLKRQGYTAVVPLLHPAVVPFEPRLLALEKAAAARVGIEVIHLPMLPWVSENLEALERIRTLAESGAGRYYVHCYLGRDRVHLVKRIVEASGAGAATETLTAGQGLDDKHALERGPIVHLDERVHLTPYPTDEEFLGRFIGDAVDHVVSLLDPDHPEDRPWVDKERAILEQAHVPFLSLPVRHHPYDPHVALDAARRVRGLPGEVAVHAFLSPASGRAPAAEAFLQAYLTGRPPLPPSLFAEGMADGPLAVIAPHVAIGPRPRPQEFGAYLRARGVRQVFAIGGPGRRATTVDRSAAAEAKLPWRAVDAAEEGPLLRTLEGDGPYYLYGDVSPRLRRSITERFGPAVPERIAPGTEARFAALTSAATPSSKEPREASPDAPAAAFLRRALPDVEMIVVLGPVLLLFTAFAAALFGWLRVARDWPVAYSRKGFHFAIFTVAGGLQVMGGLPAVMLFGGLVSLVVLYAVLRGVGFPFYEALARPADAPRQTLFILVPLATTALGGLLANLLFGAFSIVGYLVGGWGDAVGEPVGAAFGRHRYRVPSLGGVRAVRSLEGSAAVLMAGALAAFLGLLAQGVSPLTAVGVGALCGAAGALVEAFSTHGVDNLTVQVAAAGAAFLVLA